jgi:uncharacterized membrane protein (UPF0127 family)
MITLHFFKKRIWFIVVGLLAVIFFIGGLVDGEKKYVVFPERNIKVRVEVAKTIEERERGLMFREKLEAGAGMLFVSNSKKEAAPAFWMKNMNFPIDIIFISDEFKIVDIKENFQPCGVDSCVPYISAAPARYALEVAADFAAENKIGIDAIVFLK